MANSNTTIKNFTDANNQTKPTAAETESKTVKLSPDAAKYAEKISQDLKTARTLSADAKKKQLEQENELIKNNSRAMTLANKYTIGNVYDKGNNKNAADVKITAVNAKLLDIRNYHNFRTAKEEFSAIGDDKLLTIDGALYYAGHGPSRSYFMSNSDFLFSEELNMNISNDYGTFIQPIVLNEFQPEAIVYLSKLITSSRYCKVFWCWFNNDIYCKSCY